MKKVTVKKGPVAPGTRTPKRRKTVGEINRWMSANYAQVMKTARENCVRLTGKPTLGGVRRRKSA